MEKQKVKAQFEKVNLNIVKLKQLRILNLRNQLYQAKLA